MQDFPLRGGAFKILKIAAGGVGVAGSNPVVPTNYSMIAFTFPCASALIATGVKGRRTHFFAE